MKKKLIILIVILSLAVIGVGCYLSLNSSKNKKPSNTDNTPANTNVEKNEGLSVNDATKLLYDTYPISGDQYYYLKDTTEDKYVFKVVNPENGVEYEVYKKDQRIIVVTTIEYK